MIIERKDGNGFTFTVSIAQNELKQKVHDVLILEGYTLKEGTSGAGIYEKGNRVARLLLGAFVKYYKFEIQALEDGGTTHLSLVKKTSGMSGGAIGVGQVKNEINRLAIVFEKIK
ncbi:MAG: hypothetical protein R2776_08580 [Flavobacteriaceae bacterium]|nr:hypothetical protein [Flavobacteriaceae bacterium]